MAGSAIGSVIRSDIETDMVKMSLYSLFFENPVSKVVFYPILTFKNNLVKRLIPHIFLGYFAAMLNGDIALSCVVFMDKMGKGQFPDKYYRKKRLIP